MVTKIAQQPNGKYMTIQTTSDILCWNDDNPMREPNFEWGDFCKSVEYNQDFTREQLERLIKECPDAGYIDLYGEDTYSGDYYDKACEILFP